MRSCHVTGANGFLGSNVVRSLLDRGYHVTALVGPDLDCENLAGLPVEVRELDVCDPGNVRKALDGGTHLIHTASRHSFWNPDPDRVYRTNVGGTRNVLAAARDLRYERIVYTSACSTLAPGFEDGAYGEGEVADLREPGGHCKTSKIMAEFLALRFAAEGLPVVVLNPSVLVGAGDRRPTPVGGVIVSFLRRRMRTFADVAYNIVDVEDVAEGHVLALESGRRGHRYVLGGENLSMRRILAHLSEQTGLPPPRVSIPRGALVPLARANEWVSRRLTGRAPRLPVEAALQARDVRGFSSAKARVELGYDTRPARFALANAVRWFVSNGFCPPPPRAPTPARPSPWTP